jgi:hypothetical protein
MAVRYLPDGVQRMNEEEMRQRIQDLEAALFITWRHFPLHIGMNTQWSVEEHEAKWAIINKALGRDGRTATSWMTKCSE